MGNGVANSISKLHLRASGSFTAREGANARAMNRLAHSDEEHATHKEVAWSFYVGILLSTASSLCLLNHPNEFDPASASHLDWQPHIPDVGTAAYRDVTKYLDKAIAVSVSKGYSHIMACGDQQTYNRIIFCKMNSPVKYASLTPIPGEWHFTVHCLMALHQLHWSWFLCWFVLETQGNFCTKTVIEKWDSVVRYNDYLFFHETIIAGIFQYLKEVVPPAVLRDKDVLFANAKANAGESLVQLLG